MKAGASKGGPPPTERNLVEEIETVYTTLLTLLPQDLVVISAQSPNGPHTPKHPLLADILRFVSSLVADLVHKRLFSDAATWKRCLGVYLNGWYPHGSEDGLHLGEQIRQHFLAVDKVSTSLVPSCI